MTELEYLYKEYVRLHELYVHFMDSAYADFQLLAAIGILLAWEPIAQRITTAQTNARDHHGEQVLFFGFAAILIILAVIATRDLGKLSIAAFYLSQLTDLGHKLDLLVLKTPGQVFDIAGDWQHWKISKHLWPTLLSRGIIATSIVLFPFTILFYRNRKYAFIYLALSATLVALYVIAALKIY
jgi:hypothetical protein